MNPLVIFRIATRALLRNKLRSFLTCLGMIIGVGAVIAMVAIGEGAKQQVRANFTSMGTNLLVVQSGSTRTQGMRGGSGSSSTLTWADLTAIQNEVASVKYAAPQLTARGQVLGEDQNWSTQIVGTTPTFFDIRSWPMAYGSRFSDADVEGGTKVVVLGQTVVDNIFGVGVGAEAVGQVVRLNNVPFTVVGVAAKKGQSPMGTSYDDAVWIPRKTFQAKIQGSVGNSIPGVIYLSASSDEDTKLAEEQVGALLRDRHKLAAGADDDFSIRNLAEVATAREEATKTFTSLLAAIAAVSLLVGGIGIMNIMLVSVTERTREIGIRMAVGAKPHVILLQFLVESMTLSSIGGLLGVVLGVFGGGELAKVFEWPTVVRPDIIVVAVVFSAAVGVGFGLYPARKASQLDPIQALRYE
jgi:putative ABC transport system permease protein